MWSSLRSGATAECVAPSCWKRPWIGRGLNGDLGYVLLGAVAGWMLSMVPGALNRLSRWRSTRRREAREAIRRSGQLSQWLCRYYDGSERGILFHSGLGSAHQDLPFLTRDEWCKTMTLDPYSDRLIERRPPRAQTSPVNERLLKRRNSMGARLYVSRHNSLYLDQIIDGNGRDLVFRCRPCEYRQIASAIETLEHETFRAARMRRFRFIGSRTRTPFRDQHMPDLPSGKRRQIPLSIGSTVVLALKTENSCDIAIHKRSEAVLTSPGTLAVIPNFGYEDNFLGEVRSRYSVIYWNFVKEYLEELFDYEELIGELAYKRDDPDWFFELPEAKRLERARNRGRVDLSILGFGFEALSGTAAVGLLAYITDESLIRELRNKVSPNWEVAPTTANDFGFGFFDYRDERLGQWLLANRFQTSSAFALSLAVDELDARLEGGLG